MGFEFRICTILKIGKKALVVLLSILGTEEKATTQPPKNAGDISMMSLTSKIVGGEIEALLWSLNPSHFLRKEGLFI